MPLDECGHQIHTPTPTAYRRCRRTQHQSNANTQPAYDDTILQLTNYINTTDQQQPAGDHKHARSLPWGKRNSNDVHELDTGEKGIVEMESCTSNARCLYGCTTVTVQIHLQKSVISSIWRIVPYFDVKSRRILLDTTPTQRSKLYDANVTTSDHQTTSAQSQQPYPPNDTSFKNPHRINYSYK